MRNFLFRMALVELFGTFDLPSLFFETGRAPSSTPRDLHASFSLYKSLCSIIAPEVSVRSIKPLITIIFIIEISKTTHKKANLGQFCLVSRGQNVCKI